MVEVVYDFNQFLDFLEVVCNKYDVWKVIVVMVIDLNECVLVQLNKFFVFVLWLDSYMLFLVINLYEIFEIFGYDWMVVVVVVYDQFLGKDILVIDVGICIIYEFVDFLGQYYGGNILFGFWMWLKVFY